MIWRALLPSWRFFDDPGLAPQVFVRDARGGDEDQAARNWSPWRALFDLPAPRWPQLVLNARGNEALFARSLFEELLEQSQSRLDDPASLLLLPLYARCQNYVAWRVALDAPGARKFQVKIAVNGKNGESQDVLVMPETALPRRASVPK